jgi:alginate O-acetyltransferase complex protein AlgJ
MKKFIFKGLIFCLPFMAMGFEALLPLSTFTFRPDEALLYNHSGIGMPFYPDHNLQMNAIGDLCAYTNNSVKKNVLWITDKIGYRNDQFIEDPDVLLVGDSFILGSSLSQDSTLTNLLAGKLNHNLKFYNLAPASFSDFKVILDKKIIRKPKLLIFSLSERDLPSPIILNSKERLYKNSKVSVWIDKTTRLYSVNYIMSRVFNRRNIGVQSEINENMFFYKGKNQINNMDKVDSVTRIIDSYKHFCDSLDIGFLCLPLPNKETVYYREVPFNEQPNYLFELDAKLKGKNIPTINALKAFNLYRLKHFSLIYHLDDTHWNSNGVNLVADEIVKEITITTSNFKYNLY